MARPAGFSSDEDLSDDYYSGTVKSSKETITNVVDVAAKKRNELYVNILNGNLEQVVTLINDGINVNEVLYDNWTPLMLAVSIGCVSIVRKFIELGAEVNASKDKYTVLMAACACPKTCTSYSNSLEVAKLLVDSGADINSQDKTRMTAFLYAAKVGNLDLVEYLLPLCIKDAEDNQGWNALFWAVNENCVEVVEKLLSQGFSPNKTDIRSNTPLVYATRQSNDEIIALLPKEKMKASVFIETNIYEIEQIFQKTRRPKFQNDVNLMLLGMKCENLISTFQKHDVDLLTFLSLTQSKLQSLGITTPFQQQKIFNGLYKFHKHSYKKKSIPIVDKNQPYSTLDLSRAILTTIRQITVMEAALLYISEEVVRENADIYQKESVLIKDIVRKLKSTCAKLKVFSEKCDDETKPADLITNKSREFHKNRFKWSCGFVLIGGTFIIAFYNVSKVYLK